MTESLTKELEAALTAAGFTALEEYKGDIYRCTAEQYPAVIRVKSLELESLISRPATEAVCEIKIGACLSLYGAKCLYGDAQALYEKAKAAAQGFIFSSSAIARGLKFGDITHDMKSGRLRCDLSVTLVQTIKKGE
jgi:hypothetical protein